MARQLHKPNLLANTGWSLSLLDLSDALQLRKPVYYGTVNADGRVYGRYVHITGIMPDAIMIDGERVDLDVNHFFRGPYEFFKYHVQINDDALELIKPRRNGQNLPSPEMSV